MRGSFVVPALVFAASFLFGPVKLEKQQEQCGRFDGHIQAFSKCHSCGLAVD